MSGFARLCRRWRTRAGNRPGVQRDRSSHPGRSAAALQRRIARFEPLESRLLLSISPIDWTPQGPSPLANGQVEGMPWQGNPVIGALHTVLAHPSDPDILYTGSVNGGIWKTGNATDAHPTWTPLTDFEDSLSIGAMEIRSHGCLVPDDHRGYRPVQFDETFRQREYRPTANDRRRSQLE